MSNLKKSWEWYAHFETARSLFNLLTGVLATPTVVAMTTAIAGWLQGVPVMWIITATVIVFSVSIGGLLWLDQLRERKNPQNKLSILGAQYFQELNEVEHNGKKIASNMIVTGVERKIEAAHLGIAIKNEATFPISCTLLSAETSIMGKIPPRTKFPKPAYVVDPGQTFILRDERIPMQKRKCGQISGKISMTIKYGHPNKEIFEKTFIADVDVPMDLYGFHAYVGNNFC